MAPAGFQIAWCSFDLIWRHLLWYISIVQKHVICFLPFVIYDSETSLWFNVPLFAFSFAPGWRLRVFTIFNLSGAPSSVVLGKCWKDEPLFSMPVAANLPCPCPCHCSFRVNEFNLILSPAFCYCLLLSLLFAYFVTRSCPVA